MRFIPNSSVGLASFWAALSLIALLPLAAALDPSGSTEPGTESETRTGATASSRPAATSPNAAPSRTAAQSAPAAAAEATPTITSNAPPERRPDSQRNDIADTAQLSPDGSSSLDSASTTGTALAEAPAPATNRRDPPRLTPARPSLTLASQETRWSQLSDGQRNLLAPFEDQWSELTQREKQALAHMAQRFPDVHPDDQERSMKRLAAWAELSPDDRKLARYSYRWIRHLDRNEVVAAWEQYQSLTPAQRAVLAAAGSTSTTAATHPGRRTGLAAEAAQPLPRRTPPTPELPGL